MSTESKSIKYNTKDKIPKIKIYKGKETGKENDCRGRIYTKFWKLESRKMCDNWLSIPEKELEGKCCQPEKHAYSHYRTQETNIQELEPFAGGNVG